MTLREALRIEQLVEIRDKNNKALFISRTRSSALDSYLDYEVLDWFVSPSCKVGFNKTYPLFIVSLEVEE